MPQQAGSTALRRLRVMGVPEHFNYPWQLAIKEGAFERAGICVEFTACPGGTGAMLQSVTAGDADVAVALTEGIVAGVVSQEETATPLRYCGQYVKSSLRWMIATGSGRPFKCLADVAASAESASEEGGGQPQLRVAVSRLGSGSHLMAYLLALREHWPTHRLSFVVRWARGSVASTLDLKHRALPRSPAQIMRDFRSMRRSVVDASCDLFMWEWTMTSPFVESGELRPLGWLDTPWGCFGFVARRAWLDDAAHRTLLADAAAVVLAAAAGMKGAGATDACEALAAMYGFKLADAHAWLQGVEYPPPPQPVVAPAAGGASAAPRLLLRAPRGMLEEAFALLASVGIIPQPVPKQQPQQTAGERSTGGGADGASAVGAPFDVLAAIVDSRICELDGPTAAPSAPLPGAAADGAVAEASAAATGDRALELNVGVPSARAPSRSRGSAGRSGGGSGLSINAAAPPGTADPPPLDEDIFTPRLSSRDAALGATHARAAAAAAGAALAGLPQPPERQTPLVRPRLASGGAGVVASLSPLEGPAAAGEGGGRSRGAAASVALLAVLAHLGSFGGASEHNVASTRGAFPGASEGEGNIREGTGGAFFPSPVANDSRRARLSSGGLQQPPHLLHRPPSVAFADVRGVMLAARAQPPHATAPPPWGAAAASASASAGDEGCDAGGSSSSSAGGLTPARMARPASPTLPDTPLPPAPDGTAATAAAAAGVVIAVPEATAASADASSAASATAWLHDVSLAVVLPSAPVSVLPPPPPPVVTAQAAMGAPSAMGTPLPPLHLVASRPGLPRLHLQHCADGGIAILHAPLALLQAGAATPTAPGSSGTGSGEAGRSVMLQQQPRLQTVSGAAGGVASGDRGAGGGAGGPGTQSASGAAAATDARTVAWLRSAPGSAWEGSLFDIG